MAPTRVNFEIKFAALRSIVVDGIFAVSCAGKIKGMGRLVCRFKVGSSLHLKNKNKNKNKKQPCVIRAV